MRTSGSAWKSQRCERCQTQFAYQVTREFTGQGVSPYMLDNAGAQERARTAAYKGLEHALANAKEDVPCPKCLTYNADATLRLKKAKYGWMFALGLLGLFGTATMSPVLLSPEIPKAATALLVIGGVCLSAGLLFGRSRLMDNYDPNSEELRTTRQTVLGAKKTILREQYEVLMEAARASGKADELVQINWA
ncbi:MAG: hypothetical protein QM817_26790 [Archangium sp.]